MPWSGTFRCGFGGNNRGRDHAGEFFGKEGHAMTLSITAYVGYSHLFPGARLWLETSGERLEHMPEVFALEFSDGSWSSAHLFHEPGDGSWELIVEGYSTKRGTPVDERVWTVTAAEALEGGLELKLGSRLPSG
ncbi:hypothetical protein B005_2292 [Nocardiopsis alba ATCC BAA-2165]|jgi:hypothetical protein|uniref:Uncharacterized protein n=2 Tax=Nocardiopsis alba TaxID=53437 RepID=J7L7U9_NOCAA|nr:hypothetical protein B005_2292 [Nocardiopsis alba ATCC BAA-2165]